MKPIRTASVSALAALSALASLGTISSAEEFNETLDLQADDLVLVNLIGEVDVIGHDGSGYIIEIDVRGEDAGRDVINIRTDEGRTTKVYIEFPVEDEDRYVYPRLGRGSSTEITMSDHDGEGSWLSRLVRSMGGRKIRVRDHGSGLEVWADVTVKVPRDKQTTVDLGVGKIDASDVQGDVTLSTHAGPIGARDIKGRLVADTGSGHVEIENVEGNLLVDTGSGHVDISDVTGEMVDIDTGSGHVTAQKIECEELRVDTGSGRVQAVHVGADEVEIDTGSGGVVLELDRMGSGRFIIDTGSGGIDLFLPEDASADIVAETGSGGIRLDIDGADIEYRERDEVALRIGRGDARVRLDTGSGGIDITQ